MIGRLLRSLSGFSVTLLIFGCIFLGVLIKEGDFPNLLLPSHDFDDVLDNGLKEGEHVKGDLYYSLGGFASMESYTQYENSRTAAKTTGYYYLIPAGDGGVAAVYVHKSKADAMDKLTDETYEYLMGGEYPESVVRIEGVAIKMEKQLKGLEGAFREELEDMGYTESEMEEMLSNCTDGECLVIYGPAAMSTFYGMLAVSLVAILIAVLLIVRNYRKELDYDEQEANGLTKPRGKTKRNMSETSQTTTYFVNK